MQILGGLQFLKAKMRDNYYFISINLKWFEITKNAIYKMSNYTLPITTKNTILETSTSVLYNFFLLQLLLKTQYRCMNIQTDGRADFFAILQDSVPSWDRCPKT